MAIKLEDAKVAYSVIQRKYKDFKDLPDLWGRIQDILLEHDPHLKEEKIHAFRKEFEHEHGAGESVQSLLGDVEAIVMPREFQPEHNASLIEELKKEQQERKHEHTQHREASHGGGESVEQVEVVETPGDSADIPQIEMPEEEPLMEMPDNYFDFSDDIGGPQMDYNFDDAGYGFGRDSSESDDDNRRGGNNPLDEANKWKGRAEKIKDFADKIKGGPGGAPGAGAPGAAAPEAAAATAPEAATAGAGAAAPEAAAAAGGAAAGTGGAAAGGGIMGAIIAALPEIGIALLILLVIVVVAGFIILLILFLTGPGTPSVALNCGSDYVHGAEGTVSHEAQAIKSDFHINYIQATPTQEDTSNTNVPLAIYSTICVYFGHYENSPYTFQKQFNDFGNFVVGDPKKNWGTSSGDNFALPVYIYAEVGDNLPCSINQKFSEQNGQDKGIKWLIQGADNCITGKGADAKASPKLQYLLGYILGQSAITQQQYLNPHSDIFSKFKSADFTIKNGQFHLLPTNNCQGLYNKHQQDPSVPIDHLLQNCFGDMVGEYMSYPYYTDNDQLISTATSPAPTGTQTSTLTDYPSGQYSDYYNFANLNLFNGQPFFISPNDIVTIAKTIVSNLKKTFGRSQDEFDQLKTQPLVLQTNPPYSVVMRGGDSCLNPSTCVHQRYWCTDLVIDSYNAAKGDKKFLDENDTVRMKECGDDFPMPYGIGNAGAMDEYFQLHGNDYRKLVYIFNAPGAVKNIQPGYVIFFNFDCAERVASHVAIVKNIKVDAHGNGTVGFYDANDNQTDSSDNNLPGGNLVISDWKAVDSEKVVGFGGSLAQFGTSSGGSGGTTGTLGTGYCAPSYLASKPGFFTQQDANIASCICNVESGGDPNSLNTNCKGTGDYSVGLFQINLYAHQDLCTNTINKSCTITNASKLSACVKSYQSPDTNIQTAVQFKSSSGWQPWTAEGPNSKYKCWK